MKVRFEATIERHDPRLPRYVIIPPDACQALGLKGYTVARGTMNETPFDLRSVSLWDERDSAGLFFMQIPTGLCAAARVDVGDQASLELEVMEEVAPTELLSRIAQDPGSRAAWNNLPLSHRRQIAEDIARAKSQATRARRIESAIDMLKAC